MKSERIYFDRLITLETVIMILDRNDLMNETKVTFGVIICNLC